MNRRSELVFAAALLCLAFAGPVPAATTASIFERVAAPTFADGLDPSTRSAGMGGASGAVFWGGLTNHWANPALLGYTSGLRYTADLTSFLPGGDLDFDTRETTLGLGGLGFSFEGQPIKGLGKRELSMAFDYSTAYTPPQSVAIYERVRSWGAGASLAGVLADVARLRQGEAPAFTQHFDVAAGFSEKVLVVGNTIPPATEVRGVSRDLGVLVRTGTTVERSGDGAAPVRLDASYGFSILGSGSGYVSVSPIARRVRNAIAARASLETHPEGRRMLPLWLAPAFSPLLSLGLAYDDERVGVPHATFADFSTHHYGAELGITRALAFQLGAIQAPGSSARTTWGLEVALPFGRFGGIEYGYARVQSFLDPQPHRNWSVWLDPLAIARHER